MSTPGELKLKIEALESEIEALESELGKDGGKVKKPEEWVGISSVQSYKNPDLRYENTSQIFRLIEDIQTDARALESELEALESELEDADQITQDALAHQAAAFEDRIRELETQVLVLKAEKLTAVLEARDQEKQNLAQERDAARRDAFEAAAAKVEHLLRTHTLIDLPRLTLGMPQFPPPPNLDKEPLFGKPIMTPEGLAAIIREMK